MKRMMAMAAATVIAFAAQAEMLVKDGEKIAFVGDSITELGNWPAGYVNLVMEGLKQAGVSNAVKIAAGRSGDRSNRMLARIDGVLQQKPDWILISCGVNDVWHREHKGADGRHTGVDFPDYVKNMREMYDRSDKAGAKVVVLTATMITENPEDQKNKWLVEYNDFLRAEAKARKYLLVDLNDIMQKKLVEICKTDKTPGNKLTRDGVHMNYQGECMMAGAILQAFGAAEKIGDGLEKTYEFLVEVGKNLKGGAATGARLSLRERAMLDAQAKARDVKPEDLALELFQEGLKRVAAKGCMPPKARDVPKREIPAKAADSVKVKDGEKVAFVGDYYTECGNWSGRFIQQVMSGLEAAGVKKPVMVPGWQRWEQTDKMLARMGKLLEKKPNWIVFFSGFDDSSRDPKITPENTKANVIAAFDKYAAAGAKALVLTTYQGGRDAYNAFLREEAAKRGWPLADVRKALAEAKVSCDYGNFEGNCVVARTILNALGVDDGSIAFVKEAMLDAPDGGGVTIPTSINQHDRAGKTLAQFGSNLWAGPRDIVAAMLDTEAGKVWDKTPPAPRRVLTLDTGKKNPRNGEGDLIRLKDGRILFIYTEYVGDSMLDHAPAHIVKRYSPDDGETWTEPVEVFPREGKQNDMSVSLIRLKDGRLALFNLRKNSAEDCVPVVRFSVDEGGTWSAPKDCLLPGETDYYVLNNARVEQLKSGRIVLPLAKHSAKGEGWSAAKKLYGRLSCVYSDDGGVTWKKGEEYAVSDAEGKLVLVQEPGVIELKDGRLYLYARTDRGRQWQAFSKDGGKTWGDFGPSPIFGPCGPATIRRLQNGDLMLVWNDHEGHPEYRKLGPGWLVGQRAPLTIAISKDEGQTWIDRRTIEPEVKNGFFCYFATLFGKDYLLLHYYCRPYLTASCVTKIRLENEMMSLASHRRHNLPLPMRNCLGF